MCFPCCFLENPCQKGQPRRKTRTSFLNWACAPVHVCWWQSLISRCSIVIFKYSVLPNEQTWCLVPLSFVLLRPLFCGFKGKPTPKRGSPINHGPRDPPPINSLTFPRRPSKNASALDHVGQTRRDQGKQVPAPFWGSPPSYPLQSGGCRSCISQPNIATVEWEILWMATAFRKEQLIQSPGEGLRVLFGLSLWPVSYQAGAVHL